MEHLSYRYMGSPIWLHPPSVNKPSWADLHHHHQEILRERTSGSGAESPPPSLSRPPV